MLQQSLDLATLSDAALVPEAKRGTAFARHRRSWATLSAVTQSLALLSPFPAGVIAWVTAGAAAGVGISLLFALAGVLFANRAALWGNTRLREKLARKLPVVGTGEFVGLSRAENNNLWTKLKTGRNETDDNVGFASMTSGALIITTEDGTLRIARGDIRGFILESVAELPYLQWIRVEHYGAFGLESLLVMSREADTISEVRTETSALFERLIDWHTEAQLAWSAQAERASLTAGRSDV